MPDTGHDARTNAVIEHARRRAVEREIREKLPEELKLIVEQIFATLADHEKRIVGTEKFQGALIGEAATKMKGAA